jgi:hypothetical protein
MEPEQPNFLQGDSARFLQPNPGRPGLDDVLEKQGRVPGASSNCAGRLHRLLPHLSLHAGARLHLLPCPQVREMFGATMHPWWPVLMTLK